METVACLRSMPSPASPASLIRPLTGFGSSSQQPRIGGLRITEAASDQENRGQLSRLQEKEINRPPMMPSTDDTAKGGTLRPMLHLTTCMTTLQTALLLLIVLPVCGVGHCDCSQQGRVNRPVMRLPLAH